MQEAGGRRDTAVRFWVYVERDCRRSQLWRASWRELVKLCAAAAHAPFVESGTTSVQANADTTFVLRFACCDPAHKGWIPPASQPPICQKFSNVLMGCQRRLAASLACLDTRGCASFVALVLVMRCTWSLSVQR